VTLGLAATASASTPVNFTTTLSVSTPGFNFSCAPYAPSTLRPTQSRAPV
jgi:hypothetical protein